MPELAHRPAIVDAGDACVLTASDRRPRHAVYVDNAGVLGLWRREVALALEGATEALASVGLATHETSVASGAADLLGVELCCTHGCTRLSEKRYWRLERGLGAAILRTRMSSETLSALVGQCTCAGLVRRESQACFKSVYGFIEKHWERPTAIWPNVLAELRAFKGLLPLLEADWGLAWDPVCGRD